MPQSLKANEPTSPQASKPHNPQIPMRGQQVHKVCVKMPHFPVSLASPAAYFRKVSTMINQVRSARDPESVFPRFPVLPLVIWRALLTMTLPNPYPTENQPRRCEPDQCIFPKRPVTILQRQADMKKNDGRSDDRKDHQYSDTK